MLTFPRPHSRHVPLHLQFCAWTAKVAEMYDLVGLIAPRPLLVETGTRAPIFPMRAVRSSVEKARDVYAVFGARDRVITDYFEGRHQINGPKACNFLKRELALVIRRR